MTSHQNIHTYLQESEEKLYSTIQHAPESHMIYRKGISFITLGYLKIIKEHMVRHD